MFEGVVSVESEEKSEAVLFGVERAGEKEGRIRRWNREWFMKSY